MADQAYLEIVDYDEEVRPGDPMQFTVKVWNSYSYVDPRDPNHCINLDEPSGLLTYIELVDNTTGDLLVTTDTFCMLTGGSATYDITILAPEEEGEHVIYSNSYFGGTDEIFGSQFRRVSVDSDAPSTGKCLSNNDCPDGQVCVNGTCVEGDVSRGFGSWILNHPIESAAGMVGFAIVVDQLIGD